MNNFWNTIYCSDASRMLSIPDESIDLIITSPPYNVGKEYEIDRTVKEYINMLSAVLMECKRIMKVGARIAINLAGTGRKPYIPLQSYITQTMIDMEFLMRGEIIWDKGPTRATSTTSSFTRPL